MRKRIIEFSDGSALLRESGRDPLIYGDPGCEAERHSRAHRPDVTLLFCLAIFWGLAAGTLLVCFIHYCL